MLICGLTLNKKKKKKIYTFGVQENFYKVTFFFFFNEEKMEFLGKSSEGKKVAVQQREEKGNKSS